MCKKPLQTSSKLSQLDGYLYFIRAIYISFVWFRIKEWNKCLFSPYFILKNIRYTILILCTEIIAIYLYNSNFHQLIHTLLKFNLKLYMFSFYSHHF